VHLRTPSSISTAVAGASACVEVDGYDERARTGWSVCVLGTGRELADDGDPLTQRLRRSSVVSWAPGRRDRWMAVVPGAITGRRIPLRATAASFGWLPGVVS
jgi:hypothetical protein